MVAGTGATAKIPDSARITVSRIAVATATSIDCRESERSTPVRSLPSAEPTSRAEANTRGRRPRCGRRSDEHLRHDTRRPRPDRPASEGYGIPRRGEPAQLATRCGYGCAHSNRPYSGEPTLREPRCAETQLGGRPHPDGSFAGPGGWKVAVRRMPVVELSGGVSQCAVDRPRTSGIAAAPVFARCVAGSAMSSARWAVHDRGGRCWSWSGKRGRADRPCCDKVPQPRVGITRGLRAKRGWGLRQW